MDPNQMNHMAGAVAGMMGFFMLFGLIVLAFGIFLFWRIFSKAGLAGPLSLLILVPGIGWVICLCILAFAEWRVAPIAAAPYYPPSYPPPPPAYPPQPPAAL
jgi:uncharacterized membrane protein YhaH (DUF805 family)